MPGEYILPQFRYDSSDELCTRLQVYDSCYVMHGYEVAEHAFFAAVTTLGLNGPIM